MFFQRDHFAPHKSRKFEGYYTRTQLEDGGNIALIFCWVKHAKKRSNYVHVSYTPSSASGAGPTQYLQRPPTPADTLSSRKSHTLKAEPSAESMSPQRSPSGTSRSSFSPSPLAAFKYDFFPDKIDVVTGKPAQRGGHVPFTITAPGVGHMAVTPDSIEYSIIVPEKHLRVHLVLDAHTPWSPSPSQPRDGPMGGMMHLSWLLPLNWHVRSTRSRATYAVEHGRGLGASKVYGEGRAHVEKNWGGSFPRGWIWAQAFSDSPTDATRGGGADPWGLNGEFGKGPKSRGDRDRENAGGERTLCLAGGKAFPGVQAYLIGYRSPACHDWDFRPPFAVALGRLAPFLRVRHDSSQGKVELCVSSWRRKLELAIEAPPDTFMEMAAPLRGGHEPGYAHESFRARVRVTALARRWPGGRWTVVEERVLGQVMEGGVQCGALEFGGSFFRKVDTHA
ncbi:hypothetical protein L226DRAFT_245484 [Lentinus tigrinus ALCF2SS1-7]|nr:hypothetical protein L226DRAFT_245484 [Lentinus tigrinus ALCF2SS1-7]